MSTTPDIILSPAASTGELRRVMQTLGQDPGPADIQELISTADADGSGFIEFPEFCSMMTKLSRFAAIY